MRPKDYGVHGIWIQPLLLPLSSFVGSWTASFTSEPHFPPPEPGFNKSTARSHWEDSMWSDSAKSAWEILRTH